MSKKNLNLYKNETVFLKHCLDQSSVSNSYVIVFTINNFINIMLFDIIMLGK